MNEGSFFKFNKAEQPPVTPEEELAGELEAENAKLEANLEGLSEDINSIGGAESLEIALEQKPHIAASIAKRAALIAPIFVTINTIFSGSFAEAIQVGDVVQIVNFLMTVVGGSTILSAIIETPKIFPKKEAE